VRWRDPTAVVVGAGVGTLGGLIGLGGAEFRLPLLIGIFGFGALDAVILNKAMSLVVVLSSLASRAPTIPLDTVASNWPIIVNLLAGSLIGAWVGASWALRLKSEALFKVLAVLLVVMAVMLLFGHGSEGRAAAVTGIAQTVIGVVAGFAIGVVASLMGVAGGELLIPTLIFVFGVDLKLAGSLSLVVSLPTMLVGFARYSRDQAFAVVGRNLKFGLIMAAGSVVGALIGGLLLGIVPSAYLLPALAAILIASAVKVWRHR
jgi:uncharacterized protein